MSIHWSLTMTQESLHITKFLIMPSLSALSLWESISSSNFLKAFFSLLTSPLIVFILILDYACIHTLYTRELSLTHLSRWYKIVPSSGFFPWCVVSHIKCMNTLTCSSIKKEKKKRIKDWAEKLNRNLSKEDIQMAKRHINRYSTAVIRQT